ncbi:MAG: MFS transporter [Verrucomicrobiota bacterium]
MGRGDCGGLGRYGGGIRDRQLGRGEGMVWGLMDGKLKLRIAGLWAASFTIGPDVVGVGVLLAPMEATFEVSVSTVQWVVNAYAITFAMLIVTGGRLGDIFGRRRVLLAGLFFFAGASALNAMSQGIGWLVGARVLQGVGNALLWPTAVGLMFASVPAHRSGIFIGVMFGLAGLGNVVGPIVGGAVADLGLEGWRWFFVFNLFTSGTAIALLLLSGRADTDDDLKRERLDFPGIATLALGTFGFFYALDRAATAGWGSGIVLGALGLFVVMYGVFFVIERRTPSALIPKPLWSNRSFLAAAMLNGLVMPASFAMFMFVPQIGQKVWGLTDLRAALLLTPAMVMFAGSAPMAGHLYDKLGLKRLLWVGYGLCATGSLWFALVDPSAGYLGWLLPAQLFVGLSIGIVVGPAGTAAVASVDGANAGVASGIAFQWHLVLGALGIALATFFVTAQMAAIVTADDALGSAGTVDNEVVEAILADKPDAAALEGKVRAGELAKLKGELSGAYLTGFRRAYWVCFGFAVLAFFLIPRVKERGKEAA